MKQTGDIWINSFCAEKLAGSPQCLHFFANYKAMQKAQSDWVIEDEFDHSFVFFPSPKQAHVEWRNKLGPIQLCGSAAYALAWLVTKYWQKEKLQINSSHYQLSAHSQAGETFLGLPPIETKELESTEYGKIFIAPTQGVYLLQLTKKELLAEINWLREYIPAKNFTNIHAFCAFHWDCKKAAGKLRYFSPWHGREEDYVTGSIQQYLAPLVQKEWGYNEQKWQQCSMQGGELYAFYKSGQVSLRGNCFTTYRQK